MKRMFDIVLAFLGLVLLGPLLLLLALIVRLSSHGPALYWSDRVGKDNILFRMPKFRTMQVSTPEVATHLLSDPQRYLTPIGGFLRRTSLDELPQLWNILRGELSFVGPRCALHNQSDLIEARTRRGIHRLVPGLTGWAQVNGRDELSIPEKVSYDEVYSRRQSFVLDLEIIARTAWIVLHGHGVSH